MNTTIRPVFNSTTNFTNHFCNGTDPAPSPSTLSGGSAAFILIALMLGTLSQPSGSLVVSSNLGSWRVWRLSPLLCGLEGLTILITVIIAPFQKVSQRERAFTILAKRTTATHDERRPLATYLDRPKLELIIPMMLQIIKLMFIRGSKLTTAIAVLYWIDWAMIQYCHCLVWYHPWINDEPKPKREYWKVNWGGVAGLNDNIKWYARISRAFGIVLLFASNAGILGWWCWKLVLLFTWVHEDSNWPWYKEASVGLPLILLIKFMFWGPGVMGSIMLLGHGNSEIEKFNFALLRFWVVLITFIGLGIYYKFLYDDTGTYKPAWLDWLG